MLLQERTKNVLSQFLRVGISVAILTWLFKTKIDIPQTIEVLKTADFGYIYWAALIYLVINFMLLVRWIVYVRALGLLVPLPHVVVYFFIGLFFNLFLPTSTGGDIVKILYMTRDTPQKAKVVASVIVDRLTGFASIALVALISFALGYRLINDFSLLAIILGMTLMCCCILVVLFIEKIYAFLCRIFDKVPQLKMGLMNLHYNIAFLKQKKKALFLGLSIASLGQVVFALINYLIARGLHQDIDLTYFLIFIPLLCVAASFPSIGGLGVREAGSIYLFGKIGISAGVAASITLITYLFMVFVGLLGGIVYVFALSSRRVQHHQAGAGLSPQKA